jgi:hypothetical protein
MTILLRASSQSLQKLRSLLQRKLISDEVHREWLEPGRDVPSRWNAAYGEVTGGGVVALGADRDDLAHQAAFRIVINYGATDSKLEPREARSP